MHLRTLFLIYKLNSLSHLQTFVCIQSPNLKELSLTIPIERKASCFALEIVCENEIHFLVNLLFAGIRVNNERKTEQAVVKAFPFLQREFLLL